MNVVGLILALLIAIGLVVFGAQNSQPVNIHLFNWESTSVPLVLALGVAMLVGAIIALLASIPGRIRRRRERRAREREIAELRLEVQQATEAMVAMAAASSAPALFAAAEPAVVEATDAAEPTEAP